ncbi:glucose-6-phosphate isomerase, cytosolic-like [Prosopis cineraria]|uniref:glucose-6-phosphate isomerase, cytosolic-like n=1 Tax=Prosopis cineraria TaxID=364024 RepID=UPI00240F9977|nr:glucose-6-phosphate isomerase, cytosolic-like [Prosopis cineraria]
MPLTLKAGLEIQDEKIPDRCSDYEEWNASHRGFFFFAYKRVLIFFHAPVDEIKKTHLRDLLGDVKRCESMAVEFDGILLDYSRQQAALGTMNKLFELAASLKQKINSMYNREHINSTKNRSVPHVALPAPRDAVTHSDGKSVAPEVWKVLGKIQEFSERVRSASWVEATGKALKDVIAIGTGGGFLGPFFVHAALQTGYLTKEI